MSNKNLWLMAGGDIVLLVSAYVLSYLLRFEFSLSTLDLAILKKSIIPIVDCNG